jgi:hypothetical protein
MRMNKLFDLVLSCQAILWLVEVAIFIVVITASIWAAAIPWWYVLALGGAAIVLIALAIANLRFWFLRRE